jgi:hypothetical protein
MHSDSLLIIFEISNKDAIWRKNISKVVSKNVTGGGGYSKIQPCLSLNCFSLSFVQSINNCSNFFAQLSHKNNQS